MHDLKAVLHQYCIDYVQNRIDSVAHAIRASQQSANEETKSSAGDKYETGRAMAQQEADRNSGQLNEANKLMAALKRIPISATSAIAQPGSLVHTNQGNFYIAISAGAFVIDGETYFAVSQASPIGAKLTGCKAGDTFDMNGKRYEIIVVC